MMTEEYQRQRDAALELDDRIEQLERVSDDYYDRCDVRNGRTVQNVEGGTRLVDTDQILHNWEQAAQN